MTFRLLTLIDFSVCVSIVEPLTVLSYSSASGLSTVYPVAAGATLLPWNRMTPSLKVGDSFDASRVFEFYSDVSKEARSEIRKSK